MRFFTVIRLKDFLLLLIIGVLVVTVCETINNNLFLETVSAERLLPIYSVETEEKKVALTFDCAWRS